MPFDLENGYGKIDVQSAIDAYDPNVDYNSLDPFIPVLGSVGTLSASRANTSVSITIDSVLNADAYLIYKDGELISTQTGLTYTDTISKTDKPILYTYKARLINSYGVTSYTSLSDRVRINFNYINEIHIRI